MYKLTVEADTAVTVTDHPDRDAAHGALIRYVVGADYYLLPTQTSPARTTYELLALRDEDDSDRVRDRRPRSAGRAVIEELPPAEAAPS